MAQQWNEEYCCQPCLAWHGRENDGEYLVVSHVHDHRSTLPRHDRGDLPALGEGGDRCAGLDLDFRCWVHGGAEKNEGER